MSGAWIGLIVLPFTATAVLAAAPAAQPEIGRLTARIAVDAGDSGTRIGQAVSGRAAITVEKFDAASITLVGSSGAMAITVGRAGDALGNPVDFGRYLALRPRSTPGEFVGGGTLPSGLPVAALAITSAFGMRTHPLLDVRRLHAGVDLAAPTGSPIVAPSAGIVRMANWKGGYGMFVEVDHGGGIETRYGHMSRLNVVAGQRVRPGDVLGFVGSTGLSTGPHLHYEVRVNGQPINPLARRTTR